MTDLDIVKKLGYEINDITFLVELDTRVSELITEEDFETPLQYLSVKDILDNKRYVFYLSSKDNYAYTINFRLIEYTGDEYTRIRIIKNFEN